MIRRSGGEHGMAGVRWIGTCVSEAVGGNEKHIRAPGRQIAEGSSFSWWPVRIRTGSTIRVRPLSNPFRNGRRVRDATDCTALPIGFPRPNPEPVIFDRRRPRFRGRVASAHIRLIAKA